MGSTATTGDCVDCGTSTSELIVTRRRSLCRTCFARYVASKIVKRMESFRFNKQVGGHRPKLLLPLSGGVSSLVLLHVLDAQLKRQLDGRGQTAYDLVLLHTTDGEQDESINDWRQSMSHAFPDHTFLPIVKLQDVFQHDSGAEQDLEQLGLVRSKDEDDVTLFTRLFTLIKTATARADLHGILIQRLIIALAKENGCNGILWGHSDSRLAAKALAHVAKGRGGSVPNTIVDGPSLWDINFNYPNRDLYKSELDIFIQSQQDSCTDCLLETEIQSTAPIATRNSSIDDLLLGYITSQGEKYPSIMANVVRTTTKLQVPSTDSASKCKICRMPVIDSHEANNLCYGCNRMKQDIRI